MLNQTEFERPNPRHNSLRFGKGNEGLQPMSRKEWCKACVCAALAFPVLAILIIGFLAMAPR